MPAKKSKLSVDKGNKFCCVSVRSLLMSFPFLRDDRLNMVRIPTFIISDAQESFNLAHAHSTPWGIIIEEIYKTQKYFSVRSM